MDLDGGNAKQLTNRAGAYYAQCSPDSKWVVYTAGLSSYSLSVDHETMNK